MRKRRASYSSDQERENEMSSSSKRARLSSLHESTQGTNNEASDIEEETQGPSDPAPASLDDDLEERLGRQIVESIQSRHENPVDQGVAEYGTIEAIEMHQFMCHKNLKFTFGPNINFIIGHNGSGKSAILTAIMVALGGKTTSTGRAKGIKDFVRSGQQVAEVTISLKNQGDEAYKPDQYGKSIVITRRFTKTGQSTWKIKSKDGRTISTKKEELNAICDHMNLQVDNPMSILTQGAQYAAKNFLRGSSKKDMYKLFLEGTQLAALAEEYKICRDNVDHIDKIITRKSDDVPDLQAAYDEAVARHDEAVHAQEQRRKLDSLKAEYAWAGVAVKAQELQTKVEESARQERRKDRVKDSLTASELDLETSTQGFTEAKRVLDDFGDRPTRLEERREELRADIRQVKSNIMECRDDITSINNQICGLDSQIAELTVQINEEKERLESDTQAKLAEYQQKLERAQEAIDNASREVTSAGERITTLGPQVQDLLTRWEEEKERFKTSEDKIAYCQDMIARCRQGERNRYLAYGNNIPQVLERVRDTRWHGNVPLGPLGLYVKVKDAEKWAELLRNQLGRLLTAFAITDARDRPILKQILDNFNNRHIMIIIYEQDLFEYGAGEPSPDLLTVLRALEISDPWVERILINQRQIERTLLGQTRRDGEDILARIHSGHAWTADGFDLRRYPEGGGKTDPLPFARPSNNSGLLLTGDAASERRRYETELNEAQTAHQPISSAVDTARDDLDRKRHELDREERRLKGALRRAQQHRRNVEEEEDTSVPLDIATIEGTKKVSLYQYNSIASRTPISPPQSRHQEHEDEKASLLQQFTTIAQRENEHKENERQLNEELNQVKAQIEDFSARRQVLVDQYSAKLEARERADNDVQHWQRKVAEEEQKLLEVRAQVEAFEHEFQNLRTDAERVGAEVEIPRKPKDVQKEIQTIERALHARDRRRQRCTIEELAAEVKRRKETLDRLNNDLELMEKLNELLRASLDLREERWDSWRSYISLRTKFMFTMHMHKRGYHGRVLFDHIGQELALDEERSKRNEFDVFMDLANRKVTMKMMIDTAKYDRKQYVLITPQDMGGVIIDPTKMPSFTALTIYILAAITTATNAAPVQLPGTSPIGMNGLPLTGGTDGLPMAEAVGSFDKVARDFAGVPESLRKFDSIAPQPIARQLGAVENLLPVGDVLGKLAPVTDVLGKVVPLTSVVDKVAPQLAARQLDAIEKLVPVGDVLGKLAPVTDVLGKVAPVAGILGARTDSDSCSPCMAKSIISDAMSQIQPVLQKLESLQTTDITTQTLGPILDEVKNIVSGATDKVKALAGGMNASGDVSVGDVASEIAPLVNMVLGSLGNVLKLTNTGNLMSVIGLLSGAASPLAGLLQSTKSLLGDDFTSKLVPMISNTLGLVSQLGCASNFDFLGINVHDLAGKIIGGVSGLL
ncbi:Structural maintenance of chromosomes protein 6 [Paramarasmius palmivorus]|uniref:Structural maintenance of chromosomes protein 6 n=1 Tax=Paramarasmius palmivorus TaxID=297713 RepID=A0AAW0CGW3_9AGAR